MESDDVDQPLYPACRSTQPRLPTDATVYWSRFMSSPQVFVDLSTARRLDGQTAFVMPNVLARSFSGSLLPVYGLRSDVVGSCLSKVVDKQIEPTPEAFTLDGPIRFSTTLPVSSLPHCHTAAPRHTPLARSALRRLIITLLLFSVSVGDIAAQATTFYVCLSAVEIASKLQFHVPW